MGYSNKTLETLNSQLVNFLRQQLKQHLYEITWYLSLISFHYQKFTLLK